LPEPSRGEGFGLLVGAFKKDFILRTMELGCHHSSRVLQTEATKKTYRLARFKNLPIRSGLAKRSSKLRTASENDEFRFSLYRHAPQSGLPPNPPLHLQSFPNGAGQLRFFPLRSGEALDARSEKSLFSVCECGQLQNRAVR
jgi:hypothetical protein